MCLREYNGASYSWAFIIKATEALQDGVIFRVGRGDLSIWYNKWDQDEYVVGFVNYINIQDVNMTLRDIFRNVIWHWNEVAMIIPLDIRQKFNSIFLNDNTPNVIIWEAAQDESFSTKTTYGWLTRTLVTPRTSASYNSWVWEFLLPENTNFFL